MFVSDVGTLNENVIDIDYRVRDNFRCLSNLARNPFIFRDEYIVSMEGLLQSLKFRCDETRRHVRTLSGFEAKGYSRDPAARLWQHDGMLHWSDTEKYHRLSANYQNFLFEAYDAMFTQNLMTKCVLMSTRGVTLTHSVGKSHPLETVITAFEFCTILEKLRDRYCTNFAPIA